MTSAPYRILFVCTGNVCRSPFMERLMRARLVEALGPSANRIEVTSVGTGALVDEPMTDDAAEVLRQYGGDPEGFLARSAAVEDIEAADLVLTATREHRMLIVTAVPHALGKTATLREFARLLSGVTVEDIGSGATDPAEQMAAIAATAFSRRGAVPALDPADDEVPDPYRGPREGYVQAAELIDEALGVPMALLAP